MVAGIDVQFVVSGCSYPFCWHADELENEGLDPAALLQSEGFCVKPFHEELVEVADDSHEEDVRRNAHDSETEPRGKRVLVCQLVLVLEIRFFYQNVII